jgi:hypothetical protein
MMLDVWLRIDGLRFLNPNDSRGRSSRLGAIVRSRTKAATRDAVRAHVLAAWPRGGVLEEVGLLRVGPRLLDSDNLVAGAKALLDGIALAVGVNDRRFVVHRGHSAVQDPIPVWLTHGSDGAGVYAVEISLTTPVRCAPGTSPARKQLP